MGDLGLNVDTWTMSFFVMKAWYLIIDKIQENLKFYEHNRDYYAPLTLNLKAPLFGGKFASAPLT